MCCQPVTDRLASFPPAPSWPHGAASVWGRRLAVFLAVLSVAVAADPALAGLTIDRGVALSVPGSKTTIELASSGRFVVHALVVDEAARASLAAQLAAAESSAGIVQSDALPRLPYGDRIANLVVCDADALGGKAPTQAEVQRVLAPGGVLRWHQGGTWTTIAASATASGIWPSFDGGRGSMASTDDPLITLPLAARWLDGPVIGQTPAGVDIWCSVVNGGRYVQVTNIDEANVHAPARQRPLWIVARDASNGTRLWRQRYPTDLSAQKALPWGGYIAASPRCIFAFAGSDQVAAFDGATGAEIRRFALGGPRRIPGHLVWQGDRLLAQTTAGWSAFAEDGTPAWSIVTKDLWPGWGAAMITHLADHQVLVLQEGDRMRAFNLADGTERWSVAMSAPGDRGVRTWQLQALSGGSVAVRTQGELTAYSLVDGLKRWTVAATGNLPFTGRPDTYAWNGGFARAGKKFDAVTGADLGGAPNASVDRCTLPLLTSTFHISSHSSHVGSADPKQRLPGYAALRLSCNSANAVGSGLIFGIASDCMCNASHLRGITAHGSAPAALIQADPQTPRPTVRGAGKPAPAASSAPAAASGKEWPMFRQNIQRSAGLDAAPLRSPAQLWSVAASPSLVPGPVAVSRAAGGQAGIRGLTCAEGLVCVADAGHQRVLGLDVGDGRRRWAVQLGAGLDTPPTIHAGRVLFGALDGWVWCLAATDGALIWRTRLAPAEDFLPAYGQVASRWPVVGAVTVADGLVLASVGRSTAVDGGVLLAALDLDTGAVRWIRPINPVGGRESRSFNDVLIAGGRGLRFLGQPATPVPAPAAQEKESPSDTLVPAVEGLANFVRNDQDAALHGYTWAPMLYGGIRGRLLAWRDQRIFGFARHSYAWINNSTTQLKDPLAVFMAPADLVSSAASNLPAKNAPADYGPPTAWSRPLGATSDRLQACLVVGDTAWAAWTVAPAASGAADAAAAAAPAAVRETGRIASWKLADGTPGPIIDLDAGLMRDGLIATDGRLYAACSDGSVRCFHDR